MEFYGSIHNHTDRSNFRLRDSTNQLDKLCWYAAKDLHHDFIAITDHETIATAIDCQKVEKKIREEFPDFKIIRGNEIYLCRNGLNKENYERGTDRFWHWILLAKDAIGHEQIREISTRAWSRCFKNGKMIRVPTYYDDLKEIIYANPGHVIMSTACFRKGTLVDTLNGKKEIQDITENDFILNKDGVWEKVNFPTSRFYEGKGYKITFLENETPTYCTEDHQFLVTTGNKIRSYKNNNSFNPLAWVSAKDISLNKGGTKHIALYPINIKYNNNNVILKKDWENVMFAKSLTKPIKDKIEITPEVMRLFGLFLGDGHISFNEQDNRYAIGFTFNIEEFPYFWDSFVKKASEDIGITFNIRERPENNRVDIESHSVDLVKMFYSIFGDCKAGTKIVPTKLKHISPILDMELVFGYILADGHFRTKKKDKYFIGEMTAVSISKQLIKDMQEILVSLGIRSSIYIQKGKIDKNNVNHQDAWYLSSSNNSWVDLTKRKNFSTSDIIKIFNKAKEHCSDKFITINDILYKKIYFKNKEEIVMNEQVYCLNVNSHSFCCNGTIVHNCRGSKISTLILEYAKSPEQEKYNYILRWLRGMAEICGKENFFLEVQPSYDKEQILINQTYKKISEEIGFPVVISLDAHYLKKEDEPIHHAFLTAQEGERETSEFYASTYMMSREEIHEYMDKSIGIETVSLWLNNTKKIYDLCEDYDLTKPLHIPYLPLTIDNITENEFNLFKDKIKELEYFYSSEYDSNRHLAAAIVRKIINKPDEYNNERTFQEIDDNLKAIRLASEKMNTQWSAYLLNLRDYCNVIWEKGNSFMGPARGSGTGFLLLNMLDVTQINPLRETTKTYSFRFLNPERVSVLDVDLDIEGGKRPQVYSALQETYGADRVSKVLTIRTEKSKSALLTACRGLNVDPDEAAYLASFIKADRGTARTLAQTFYGDVEEDIPADKKFQELMTQKYPKVWEVAQYIEGLCCGVGSHAGGVIFYDEPITKSTALMCTSNGDVCTQFDLHTCEDVSLIKIDLLSIEALDRMRACVDLLCKYNYLNADGKTLKQIYQEAIGIYNIERKAPKMWELLNGHEVQALFQMEQDSGIKGIAAVHPNSIDDLAALNAVIRLMAPEKGAEQPVDKFARFKKNYPYAWQQEMREWGVDEKYWSMLESIIGISYGMCIQQEQFMMLVQQPEIGGFGLLWADRLRKSIAKKNPKDYETLEKEFFEGTKTKQCDEKLCNYVWRNLIALNRGYGFNAAHTLAYSLVALQELNLCYKNPIIFWNTANLIVDSGSMNLEEEILTEDEEEEVENSSADYGRIAAAIGKMKSKGISFSLPDINKSDITFTPDIANNTILYGIRGITRIGNQIIKTIFANRSYISIEDFLDKVKVNKTQMVSLIKAGVFDKFYNNDRKLVMNTYLNLVADKKKRITLQNMQMLIEKGMIPEELDYERRLFNFNKYIKKLKSGEYYNLDTKAYNFYVQRNPEDYLEDVIIEGENASAKIKVSKWDNLYKKGMDPVRDWMKANQQEILNDLNNRLFNEIYEKYASGTISHWEMESLNFYYHEHELANLNNRAYGIVDFFKLPEEPEVDRQFTTKDGSEITMFKINRIAGTVIDKDKNKSTVTLLTTTGVVTVKVWKNQFAKWDKQISARGEDGIKHVLEKSTFQRGNKLIITGIRRGDNFIPKKYKNTELPLFEKIISMENGMITESTTERLEIDE